MSVPGRVTPTEPEYKPLRDNLQSMYDTILLPTDGSEGARAAIATAIEYARSFDATVHALYVIDERFVEDEFDVVVEAAERRGEMALDDVSKLGGPDVRVEKHLRRGTPHEEILDAVEEYGADVIVMGTHGRTGLARFINLGSVTERVVRFATVDVVTVPLQEPSGRS